MFSKFSFAPNLVVIKLCNIILLTLYLLLCFYNKYIRNILSESVINSVY